VLKPAHHKSAASAAAEAIFLDNAADFVVMRGAGSESHGPALRLISHYEYRLEVACDIALINRSRCCEATVYSLFTIFHRSQPTRADVPCSLLKLLIWSHAERDFRL